MPKKIDFINDAYEMIRISGLTLKPQVNEVEKALRRLDNMMAELEAKCICIGWTFEDPADPNADVETPTWANNPIAAMLAPRLMPDFNKNQHPQVKAMADSGYNTIMLKTVQIQPVPYPNRMPIGSGNHFRNEYLTRFYRPGSENGQRQDCGDPTPVCPDPDEEVVTPVIVTLEGEAAIDSGVVGQSNGNFDIMVKGGDGVYTFNFKESMENVNYVVIGAGLTTVTYESKNLTSVTINTYNAASSLVDNAGPCVKWTRAVATGNKSHAVVNANGTMLAKSGNVLSSARISTGLYRITYANPYADANNVNILGMGKQAGLLINGNTTGECIIALVSPGTNTVVDADFNLEIEGELA